MTNEKRNAAVNKAMVSVKECLTGNHARGILHNIEQQLKFSYRRGYEDGQVMTRCNECRHWQRIKATDWCLKLVRHTEPDFFCGFGEEVDNATTQGAVRE